VAHHHRRVVARLSDDRLHGWRWEHAVGFRVDPGREAAALDFDTKTRLMWTGPGIAPLTLGAVYRLPGTRAMIGYPGLVSLRVQVSPRSCDASRSNSRIIMGSSRMIADAALAVVHVESPTVTPAAAARDRASNPTHSSSGRRARVILRSALM
jgi:hypothetical protein